MCVGGGGAAIDEVPAWVLRLGPPTYHTVARNGLPSTYLPIVISHLPPLAGPTPVHYSALGTHAEGSPPPQALSHTVQSLADQAREGQGCVLHSNSAPPAPGSRPWHWKS